MLDDGLHTVLREAEAILKDRPITKMSDDPCDLEPLTLNHQLTLKRQPVYVPGVFKKSYYYVKRKWKQIQYDIFFWKRWIKEYLPLLQARQKWTIKRCNLVPDDVVLVADSIAPHNSWLLGRVLETLADRRGWVRSANPNQN